ncbi:MAG: uroporphyrinogen-III C-methyltransferase [Candidatus Omnitrophica bacterium]|nr:uroporphyrinogen-III C-methyltransferase [Candidatus Omnitrophota bacterium]MBU4590349.1 uroporphyrinogen-III C-methyltransferase [Candidatus Omnitrophota bacterium]
MPGTVRVGTRKSPLALKQVEEVLVGLKKFHPDVGFDIVTIDTYGDMDKKTPISNIEGTDFFTREIDHALLRDEIDIAVHSAKDLPDNLKEGIKIALITESIDPYDCLVSKSGLKLSELPPGAKIGTSSSRRKTQLKKYRSDFQIVDIRGNIEERLRLLDDRERRVTNDERRIDAIVIAACALLRLGLKQRITERLPFEILRPHPLQGSLAVVTRKDKVDLINLVKTKKVYIVGAGPGRPDLISVRGLRILKEADVVIYDYLVDKALLDETKPESELISCGKLGKNRFSGKSIEAQARISELIVEKAKEGRRVVRLKNGDATIFSRLREELEALTRNKIEFEIVPGVTAASAAAGFSGIPLTDRHDSSSVIFLTGHESDDKRKTSIDWNRVADFESLVIYMGVDSISKIVSELIKSGKSGNTPAAVVSKATDINQKTVRGKLKNIAEKVRTGDIEPPAIFIIGKTAELEKDFNWFRKNKRVLFTGLSKERFFTDGTYYHLPLIDIGPLDDYKEFDSHLKKIRQFDWIVFASRYGVEYFFGRLKKIGHDSRILNNIKIAGVGNSTKARLLDFGISADLVPQKESSEGLIEEFEKIDIRGKNIFLPRSDISDKGLEKAFQKLGAIIATSSAYRNRISRDLPDLDLTSFDEVMFTSPSTVRNFRKRYGRLPEHVKAKCIGDVTLREAKRCRLID